MRERRLSRRTEDAYVYWIRRYIVANDRRHPSDLDERDVGSFLSALVADAGVSASTQNQALAALSFLYDHVLNRPLSPIDELAPARRSNYVPVVLSSAEVRSIAIRLA